MARFRARKTSAKTPLTQTDEPQGCGLLRYGAALKVFIHSNDGWP
ncbi:MAG: hypothetical protein ACFB14_15335 [Leptolyngbyaceae cyanobacterium]